jgi:hypothetical protein
MLRFITLATAMLPCLAHGQQFLNQDYLSVDGNEIIARNWAAKLHFYTSDSAGGVCTLDGPLKGGDFCWAWRPSQIEYRNSTPLGPDVSSRSKTVAEQSEWNEIIQYIESRNSGYISNRVAPPVGAPMQDVICAGQVPPAGWVIVSVAFCTHCPHRPGDPCAEYSIRNLNGLPRGTTSVMCVGSTLPPGWRVVRNYPCISCQYSTFKCVQSDIIKE